MLALRGGGTVKTLTGRRAASYRLHMLTRPIAAALLALGLVALAPAQSGASSPDVRVMSMDQSCRHGVGVYWFHLRNSGEHRRGVRVRIVWQGEGRREHYSRRVRSHDGRMLRMKVAAWPPRRRRHVPGAATRDLPRSHRQRLSDPGRRLTRNARNRPARPKPDGAVLLERAYSNDRVQVGGGVQRPA